MTRFPAPAEVVPAAELGRIHLVGIGGVGMAPLARAMLGRGLPLSGSDIKDSATVRELRDLGAAIAIGQAPENLDGVDTVVVSTDIPADNIEVVEAKARGLRLLHRASALASLMPGHRSVAIAGTHGKTTTSSMVTVALRHAGLDPSFVIGGEIGETGESGHAGSGDILIAEADESDGTFTHYRPDISVITNIELDHPDHFADVAQVRAEFQDFADRLRARRHAGLLRRRPGRARHRRADRRARHPGADLRRRARTSTSASPASAPSAASRPSPW